MPAEASAAFDFHLFVSYSRQHDSRLVRRIEPFLESFHKRVPARSRSRLTPLSLCVDGNDFKLPSRSKSELVSRDVPNVIIEHLGRSKELLVLCSAAATKSSWVNQEIEWFIENRGAHAIRLALTDGADPLAEPERYFAPSLIARGLHRNICYDLRGYDRTRARQWSRVADGNRELVRLAADLNDLAAGEIYPLWLEEERRRLRALVSSGATAAVLIFAGMGYGMYQRSAALDAARDRAVAEAAALRADRDREAADAAKRVAQADQKLARAEAARTEMARQAEEQKRIAEEEKRKAEEEKRKAADANARTQEALRLASDAFERLYRNPAEALRLAAASQELQPSATADRALADAYRVAIFRNENSRQARRLSGSGPGYLAARWSQSQLSSVISPDGRYLVVISPRGRAGVTGPDGRPLPGELYLINNETQRPIQLDNCRDDDTTRRVESVGFDIGMRNLFVTRHYNLTVYSLTGDCLGVVLLECCTKSPIHVVEGYLADRYLLAADTKGGLWLAELKGGPPITVRSEWSRDTVTSLVLSADRSRAIVISESGRATMLSLAAGGRPVEVEIARSGVLAASFHPQSSDLMAIAGVDGLTQIWKLENGRPVLDQRFALPDVPIESVAFTTDGARLVAIAEDLRIHVLRTGTAQPVATLAYPIEWSSSRKVPNHYAEYKPGRFEESGDRIPFPDPRLAVDRVDSLNGRTWLFTSRDPDAFSATGPALLIDGDAAIALPSRDIDVHRVESRAGSTWLYTTAGLYELTPRGIRRVLPPKVQVAVTTEIGSSLWFGTDRGAWRIEKDSVARFTRTDVQVSGITEIDGKPWFATDSGVYRLDARDQLVRVTDEATVARRISRIRGRIWVLTGKESEPGPALLVRDLSTRAFPGRTGRVKDVVDVRGETWLLGLDGLYRVDDDSARRIDGIGAVAGMKELAGHVIAFEPSLLGAQPAFVIKGDHAVRLIPGAGVTRAVVAENAVYLTTAIQEELSLRPGPLYRLEGEEAIRVTPSDSRVAQIDVDSAGNVRLGIEKPGGHFATARLDGDRIIELGPSEDHDFQRTKQAEGTEWLLGNGRACLVAGDQRHCFNVPGFRVVGVRHADKHWWLLTQGKTGGPGPAYRIEGDRARAIPDETVQVVDVDHFAGATWLVTRRDGKAGPLLQVD